MANVDWFDDEIRNRVKKETVKNVNRAALLLEREVKKELSNVGTGRPYKRGKKVHRASSAGQPPAVDTGTLRASISSVVDSSVLKVEGWVGSNKNVIASKSVAGTDVEYGYYLEVGTKNIQPRPFLRPTLRRLKHKIGKILAGG